MKYRLLIVDIDGTLVGRERNISDKDKNALTRARNLGLYVSLCTGRISQSCLPIIRQLSLDGYHIFFDGALVSNPDNRHQIYVQPLDKEIVKQAVEFARRNDTYLELYSATHFFIERETQATELHRQLLGLEPIITDFSNLWQREPIIKAELVTSSAEDVAKAHNFRSHFSGRLHFSVARSPAYPGVDFINVVDPGVSKGKALEALVSYLGVNLNEVMAIGDGTNDISLLSLAGLPIAMGNAFAEVKTVARYVTLDVDHSGVAAAVEKFLLSGGES